MWKRLVVVISCAFVLTGCSDQPGAGTAQSAPPPAAAPAAPSAAASSAARKPVQARWWEWAASEPAVTNAVTDLTGEHCARNQPGDVWFLAGSFGERAQRRCTVPLGMPLVAPAINRVGNDEEDCRSFMAEATGTIELDGAELPLKRFEHEPIMFTATAGNPVTESAGISVGQGCGLWAQIAPLTAGEHKLRIEGRSGTFSLVVEYTLLVSAASASAA